MVLVDDRDALGVLGLEEAERRLERDVGSDREVRRLRDRAQLGRLFWTRDEIRAKLAEKLSNAFDRVWDMAEDRKVPLRTGALVSGIREVSDALQARGIFP